MILLNRCSTKKFWSFIPKTSHRRLNMNCVYRTYSHLFKIRVKHKTLQHGLTRNASQESGSQHRHKLLIATYISFGIGGVLLTAIVAREIKRMRLSFKGIQEMNVPAWRRVKLYKYKDTALPGFVVNQLDDIENFEVRDSDVWVVSFPRSGTTWLQEIVYLINTDLDFNGAQSRLLDDRFPYFEFMYPGLKAVNTMPSPRLIKSHLPLRLLPSDIHEKKPKIIYIARNPKDVVVSFYYFTLLLNPVTRYSGKFDEFCDLFIHDKVMYTPWSSHVLDFWDKRNDDNILFIKYEDLQKDTEGTIRTIAKFLGKTLTDKEVELIKNYCSFERMKKNDMSNHSWFKTLGVSSQEGDFIRKGKVGEWAKHLSFDLNQKLNKMISLRFRDSDLIFDYRSTEMDEELKGKNDSDS